MSGGNWLHKGEELVCKGKGLAMGGQGIGYTRTTGDYKEARGTDLIENNVVINRVERRWARE